MNLRTFLVLVLLGAVMLLVSVTLYGLAVGDEYVRFTRLMQTYLVLSCAVGISGGYLAFCPVKQYHSDLHHEETQETQETKSSGIVRREVISVAEYGYCLKSPYEPGYVWLEYGSEELKDQAMRLTFLYGTAPIALVSVNGNLHFELADVRAALLDSLGSALSDVSISVLCQIGDDSYVHQEATIIGGSATSNAISGGTPMQVLKDNPGKQVIALSRTLSDQSGEKRYNCYIAL